MNFPGIPVFGKNPGLAYYTSSGDQDPYVVLKDEEDLAQELEEMEILPTDNMLVACKTEDDVSHLEVFLWEGEEDNLYVHHDIMLPSFPLCSEWLDFRVGKKTGIEGSGKVERARDMEIWDADGHFSQSIPPHPPPPLIRQLCGHWYI